MKAIVYDKKASPERLVCRELEKPVPNKQEVLIKIFAASPNAADYRSMQLGIIPKKKIFGSAISGIVEAVGRSVQRFKPGDEVIADLADFGFGGFAAYTLAPEESLVLKPKKMKFEVAAALPVAATTALQALRDKGKIQKGQKVLIIGSSGGVGTFAVQLAKYFETEVTAVCSTRNIEQSKKLGADFIIDYTKEDFTKNTERYDLIIAINGKYSLLACKRMLNRNGTYVMVGGAFLQIFKALLFGRFLSFGTKKIRSLAAKPHQQDLEFIAQVIQTGKIEAVIEGYYSLEKTADAMNYLAAGHARGKLVIKVEK